MMQAFLFSLLIWILSPGALVHGLRLTKIVIPHFGVLNDKALLECHFDLENVQLYSLKWYKDGHEFFRFKPTDNPPITVFPLNGVTVNANDSSINQVSLEQISMLSKGMYRCEISADAPSFQTIQREQFMNVMVLPSDGPELHGVHPWYNIGDNVTANCSVEKTFPQPRITWYVNGEQFKPEECWCVASELVEEGKATDGTTFFTASSQVEFQLDTPFLRDGHVTVECKVGFYNSHVVLRRKAQSNVKVGFGRHYYANIFSNKAAESRHNLVCGVVLFMLSVYKCYMCLW